MGLTKSNRDAIRYSILGEVFSGRIMQIALRRRALAYRVYSMVVDIEAVAELGKPWVTYDRTSFLAICDRHRYPFNLEGKPETTDRRLLSLFGAGRVGWHSDAPGLAEKVPLPYDNGHRLTAPFEVESDLAFVDEYRTIRLEYDGLAAEIEQRAGEIDQVLKATSTASSLAKKWPEIKGHIPAHMFEKPKPKSKADTSALTKSLGLKKEN